MGCFSFSQDLGQNHVAAVAEAAGLFAEAASAQERVRLALEAQDRATG